MKCSVCHSETVTVNIGGTFFVMCQDVETCALAGAGRPLSDGKPSASEAEASYREDLERRARERTEALEA